MKAGLPLRKNVLTPLAKVFLLPSWVTAAASATDEAIQNKIYGSGMTTIIISNEEMKSILEIVKHLEESGILNKVATEKTENEVKEQKGRIPRDGKLGANTLANKLGKAIMSRTELIRAGEGTSRVEKGF